jgi:hypothetical protein
MARNHIQIEIYRTHAAECVALARTASNTDSKVELLEMARGWLLLVEQGTKNGETILVYETPPIWQQQSDG